MESNDTPKTTDELLAAMADGELDLRDQPDAADKIAQLAQSAQAGQAIARHQQLKQACARAMDGPEMKCPPALAAKLKAMDADAKPAPYAGPPVLARIGQWAPAAIAAVLLVAATVMFVQSGGAGPDPGVASLLSVNDVQQFDQRHADCAMKPDILKRHERFGGVADFEKLPVKLSDYFQTSTDGMKLSLSGVGYDYQLTGVCGLPGDGAVHIIYHHQTQPQRSISLWLRPDNGRLKALESDRIYVEAGDTLDHPVIVWRKGGMVYYLLGDSLEDAHDAVDALRNPA